jgi:hypothetical protein
MSELAQEVFELRRRRFVAVDGVMWCEAHHGIADETNTGGDVCDNRTGDDDDACEMRALFFELPS